GLLEAAAARGIPVNFQKPLGGDLATARTMVETARAAGITFVAHENFRFQPWHREIRRLIEADELGKLMNVGFRLRPGDGQGPDAYLARQPYFQTMKRFLVHETAIHLIDVFRFLMGEVTGVFARLRRLNPVIRGEDAGLIVFDFVNGAAGLFDGNRLVDHPADNTRLTMGEMWVEGSKGYVRLDGFGHLFLKPHGEPERRHPYDWQDQGFAGDCVHALQAHVVRHFEHGTPLENEAGAYLRNLEIEDAIYSSNERGERLLV
ncbi:MAG: Gfo/Idh/MocA family oxidoreductase, partial [Geminicoccaceae bacterium]|nr:Gfo/Idh/MocA family oxidoreductase [Geminicoccaceae bacterium]